MSTVLRTLIESTTTDLIRDIRSGLFQRSRTFYGESFGLCALQRQELLESDLRLALLAKAQEKDRNSVEYHSEFITYALAQYTALAQDAEAERLFRPLQFGSNTTTNWKLLRCNAKAYCTPGPESSRKALAQEAIALLASRTLPSGMLVDAPGVRSFQYHCFSLCMVWELFEHTRDPELLGAFQEGVEFIRNFILENGDTLYVGRGQQQLFGYGALVYALSVYWKLTGDSAVQSDLERVLGFVDSARTKYGRLPLVVTNGLEKSELALDLKDASFHGWYAYNNYFDYLPFFIEMLLKADKALRTITRASLSARAKRADYYDGDFLRVTRPRYSAVIARPGGPWTNDLPFPYIVAKGQSLTPCYGGEQHQRSLYSERSLPLPYHDGLETSLRRRSHAFLRPNRLLLISPLGILDRRYRFLDDRIEIDETVRSPLRFRPVFLLPAEAERVDANVLLCNGLKVRSSAPLLGSEKAYSASGELLRLTSGSKRLSITLEVPS